MIKVFEDWYITVETNPVNYVVRKGNGEKEKNGKWKDRARGYFSTPPAAIKFMREQIIAERLSGGVATLGGALATVSKLNEEFCDALKSAGLETT